MAAGGRSRRSRPRLVRREDHVRVEAGVVEEVERLPALARRDLERRHLPVEVLRAVHVARIAHVLVVLRRAGEREGVVPPDRVADDLDQRIHVHVVELPLQAGLRVRLAHEASRRGRVEASLLARLELAPVEREEVRALLALDVDHLDELTRANLVGERGRGVDCARRAAARRAVEEARARRTCGVRSGGSRRGAPRRAARRRGSVRPARPRRR